MSIAEAGALCCLCFFPHRAKCEKSSGRTCLLLSQLRLFPVTFQPEKIFTPENREDNFPSLTRFQWHLACVRRSSVRNSKSEKTKPEQCPKLRMFHQIESKILVCFSNTHSLQWWSLYVLLQRINNVNGICRCENILNTKGRFSPQKKKQFTYISMCAGSPGTAWAPINNR